MSSSLTAASAHAAPAPAPALPVATPFGLVFRPPPGLTLSLEAGDDAPAPPPPPPSPALQDVELDLCGAWRACTASASDCSSTLAPSSGPSSPRSEAGAEAADCGACAGYVPGRILQDRIAHGKAPAVPLSLDVAVEPTACGTAACPTVGSAGHWLGVCKPCDFLHKGRCTNGAACKYCHLCGPDTGKLIKKQRKAFGKAARRVQAASAAPWQAAAAAAQSTHPGA